ncbi:ABC transporter permease [Streptomyces polygonati]|uniref:ABC transporter permease n=1 Tax=Streptomyces polygonati TaxID=1617087 RepID=A0ABV8HFI2_9ACTN
MTAAGELAAALRRTRRYLPMASASLHTLLQYRISLLTGVSSTAVSTTVQLFLWRAIYAGAPGRTLGGMTRDQMATYILVSNLLVMLLANRVEDEVSGEIYRGDIAVNLVRPLSYPLLRFFACLPVVGTNAVLAGLPLAALLVAVPGLAGPGPADAALFVAAAVFSVLIGFAVNFLVGMTGFVTVNTWGIRYVKGSVVAFFSGQVVPIALMPAGLAAVARALPFQSMVGAPARLFLGQYDDRRDALWILGQQALWAVALLALSALLWRRAVGRLEVLGG